MSGPKSNIPKDLDLTKKFAPAVSEERKKRYSILTKKQMANTKFRKTWNEKFKKGIIEREQDPIYRKKIVDANKRKAKDPKWLKANAEAVKKTSEKYWNDEEAQKNRSKLQKKIAQRPEIKKLRKVLAKQHKALYKDVKFKKKHQEKVKERLSDPVVRKKHLEAIKKRSESASWKKAQKKATQRRNKIYYSDPAYREKMSKRTKKAMNRQDVREKILKNAEKASKPVVTPFGEYKSVRDAINNCPVALEGAMKLKPHLYYYKDQGPGKPTYETVVKTPQGTFNGVRPAFQKITGRKDDGGRTWWKKITKLYPKEYYKAVEPKREWGGYTKKG